MPGVVVTTQTQVGPSAALRSPSGQFFLVGLTQRGAIDRAVRVRGMADVENLLGAWVAYGAVHDQLATFFAEGGLQAHVARIVGPAASVGTLLLSDRAETMPLPTLRLDAANPGAWSSQLQIQVLDGSVANTFRIIGRLGGNVVEDETNLPDPAGAVHAFAHSPFLRLTNLGSTTAPPDNNPAVAAATSLSAGGDDRASIGTAAYVNGLRLFPVDLGDGAVAIPGQNAEAIWTAIDSHCGTHHRIGLLAAGRDDDSITLLGRAGELDSEFSGIFVPWLVVPDGANATRTISPEGYVAACRARAHDQIGPWAIPAGRLAIAATVADVHHTFSADEADALDQGRVNVVRVIGATVRLYGWRSLSANTADYWFLKDRDLLNHLVVEAEKRLEDYVFATIDTKGHLLSQINASLTGLVQPIAQAGGLYPLVDPVTNLPVDPGYRVITGAEVNTAHTLANNQIRARLMLRISPAGALVSLVIVKAGVQSGL